MTSSPRLPFDEPAESVDARIDARDRASRERAVDPRFNVALEASAGTGKTRVLVDRYINLLREGVDPSSILAITFTRKAAAEMRARIVATLRAGAVRGEITAARWRELRDRLGDIAISTIDAFCLSLLREFPLEADVDPAFTMADETEVPRLVDEALDRALRICRGIARDDEDVALAFAQLGERRARAGLAVLLNRRIVAPAALRAFLASGPRHLGVADACQRASDGLRDALEGMPGGIARFVDAGPLDPAFTLLARDLERLAEGRSFEPAGVQAMFTRVREHFLTQDGSPRKRLDYSRDDFASTSDWQHQRNVVVENAAAVQQVLTAYRRDLNVIVSRGISRMFQIALAEYRRTLEAHAVLDFSDVLLRALDLLRQMDEFAQSRYRLESRYHHILVDEFQDTSRAQWELVSLLVQSWGHGLGLSHTGPLEPSIFIVGDRKQSIYGFRDADVSVLDEASRYLGTLRPDGDVRRAISRSFRALPPLLAFVNDLCTDMDKAPTRRDRFRYGEQDRFPIDQSVAPERGDRLGLVVSDTPERCAELTAAEIARLLDSIDVRDRDTGVRRRARPADIAILFRTRESHREFEESLAKRGIPAYVYKGLGFFDADEIKDSLALLWYLADPLSDRRAAAFLRSRFVRLSDEALRRLAPRLSDALRLDDVPAALAELDSHDRRALEHARCGTGRWRGLVDRLPPAELFDVVLAESAYGLELRGPRLQQARENLKKMRALIRRIQNRGYATLGRIAEHVDLLSTGDESNAVIDALDAVNLMTVHASKGLEFPIVFVVNLARGTGNRRDPVRITSGSGDDQVVSVSVGDFQSEVDEDSAAKEREETKRLLYVALTRARDYLYLGSVLKDGRLQPGRGSLAEVLPPTLAAVFSAGGAPAAGSVAWQASSGGTHGFRVCGDFRLKAEATLPAEAGSYESGTLPAEAGSYESGTLPAEAGSYESRTLPAEAGSYESRTLQAEAGSYESGTLPVEAGSYERATLPAEGGSHESATRPPERGSHGTMMAEPKTHDPVASAFRRKDHRDDDFEPLNDVVSTPRTYATALGNASAPTIPLRGADSDRLIGTLVHRLFEQFGLGATITPADIERALPTLVGPDRLVDAIDLRALAAQAVSAYAAVCQRTDVQALCASGQPLHEVPFTMATEKGIVRGTIDCVIHQRTGALTILEFKTGRARAEHQAQLDLYKRAAEQIFPGAHIDGVLIYADTTCERPDRGVVAG